MNYEKLKESYESLWKILPQNVYADLNTIWLKNRGEQEEFREILLTACQYNVSGTALFLYKHQGQFSNIAESVLDKVEQSIMELPETSSPEEENAKLEQAATLWEALVLSWTPENEEKVVALLEQLYYKTVAFTEEMDWRQKKKIVDAVVDNFLKPMNEKALPFPSSDTYIRSLYFLSKVLDELSLTGKEVYYDKILYMDKIDDFTKVLTRRYVDFMYKSQYYRACSSFLHKMKYLDYEVVFGVSEDAFWLEILKSGSEHLAECLQRMKGYTSKEGLIAWKKQIHQLVDHKECLAWCDWRGYLGSLVLLLDSQSTTYEVFYQTATEEMPDAEFPWETTSNNKRIVGALQYIFSEMFRRDWDVSSILELWNTSNLYDYSHRYVISVSSGANAKFIDKSRMHNWELNYQVFMNHAYAVEEKVRIFMNSPLRLAVEFRDFISAIAKDISNKTLRELFDAYRLDGYLSYTDYVSPARGRMRFELNARCMCTKYFFKSRAVKKDATYYNSLLFLEEDWYRKNENEVREMKRDSKATFKLWGYGSLGKHGGVVLIYDVQDFECDDINPIKEMNAILNWMKEIRETQKYIPVSKDDFHYVYPLSKYKLNEQFAIEILETISALRKSPQEVMHFLRNINQGRMDKISEFQYILTHNKVSRFRARDKFFVRRVKELANIICAETSLTKQHKCNIYMNTCLKVFYPLPLFWNKINATEDDMISFALLNNELDHFMFLTVYEGEENDNGIFKLAPDIKIKDSIGKQAPFTWKWRGQTLAPENKGKLFRVTIKDIDMDEKTIWISEVKSKDVEDVWANLVKRIMDLKLNPSLTYVDSIRKDIETMNMDYFVKNRIVQLAMVFQALLNRSGKEEYTEEYNLFWCTQILNVFGEGKNPFMQKERFEALCVMTESERERIKDGCEVFLQNRKNELESKPNSFSMHELEEFFVRSPYNLVYSEEEFIHHAQRIFTNKD